MEIHCFGHLETIKTEGIDGFEDVGRKMASLRLHPNATDASVQRRLTMLGPLLDFYKNHLELVYAFLCVMAYVSKEPELLHNDLLPSNVMFHFGALDDVHQVFIGVIDWGRASRSKEKSIPIMLYKTKPVDDVFWLCVGGCIHLWFL